MLMEISINKEKCQVPLNCKKCLQICPQCVFRLHATGIARFVEIPAENWKLGISFPDLCVGCMECVKICPEKAITVRPARSQSEEVA